jgi:hypothetical protein
MSMSMSMCFSTQINDRVTHFEQYANKDAVDIVFPIPSVPIAQTRYRLLGVSVVLMHAFQNDSSQLRRSKEGGED